MKRTITLRYLFTLCVMTLISAFYGGNLASAQTKTVTITPNDVYSLFGNTTFNGVKTYTTDDNTTSINLNFSTTGLNFCATNSKKNQFRL
ncbi:MAG: hypothetical protein SPK03_06145, partial [Alloprevotella sp.]|nr:hypothetical protein [Alloprevotella sp.]